MTDAFTAFLMMILSTMSPAGTPDPIVPPPSSQPSCHLAWSDDQPHTLVATASAASDASYSGTYSLLLESKGANVIRSKQHGDFAIDAGQTGQLAAARVEIEGQAVEGTLQLTWGHSQTTTCSLEQE